MQCIAPNRQRIEVAITHSDRRRQLTASFKVVESNGEQCKKLTLTAVWRHAYGSLETCPRELLLRAAYHTGVETPCRSQPTGMHANIAKRETVCSVHLPAGRLKPCSSTAQHQL